MGDILNLPGIDAVVIVVAIVVVIGRIIVVVLLTIMALPSGRLQGKSEYKFTETLDLS